MKVMLQRGACIMQIVHIRCRISIYIDIHRRNVRNVRVIIDVEFSAISPNWPGARDYAIATNDYYISRLQQTTREQAGASFRCRNKKRFMQFTNTWYLSFPPGNRWFKVFIEIFRWSSFSNTMHNDHHYLILNILHKCYILLDRGRYNFILISLIFNISLLLLFPLLL